MKGPSLTRGNDGKAPKNEPARAGGMSGAVLLSP
jgi:hypothetical protein